MLSLILDEIPHITFTVPFPYQLAASAATVIGFVISRAIYNIVKRG
jgi:hypothetical protein